MKYKKQVTAVLLSLALAAGMALPSFAETETAAGETAQTEQSVSEETGEDNPPAGDDAEAEDATAEQSDSSESAEADDADAADASDADDTAEDAAEDTAEEDAAAGGAQDAETDGAESDGTAQTGGMPSITIDAKASLLVNGETGEVLHAENAHERLYPASCTKIMTALLVLESCGLSDTVTIEEADFADISDGASSAGLQVGEQLSVEDLLYCLMLPSGNEAANALARAAAGSVDDFVKMMNDRAAELGCTDTHFVNPNGLHDDDHYTSAYDLYLITRTAMQDSTFATIVNTAQKKLPATSKNPERIIYTTNEMIYSSSSDVYYDNCYGVKTGHTSQAGYCLVSFAKKGSYTYYSVVLGAEKEDGASYAGSFTETIRLFDWAFDSFSMQTATKSGAAVTECPVRLGKGTDYVTLVTSGDVSVLLPTGASLDDMDVTLSVEESYDAPIAQGEKLGTVTYSYMGMECATADLLALSAVERSSVLYAFDQIAKFFAIPYVRIAVAVIAVIFVIYLILSFIAGRNRRRRRRRARRLRGKQGANQGRSRESSRRK